MDQELSSLSILMLGLALGLRHATEADHLAAVSTLVVERKSLLSSSVLGGFWGVGHTLSLLIVGIVVILLKVQIPEAIATRLEGVVGIMLVVLGLNALRKLFSASRVHVHAHQHDGHAHTHLHVHEAEKAEPSHHGLTRRSVIVGMVHGLAGSGALMLLVVPTIGNAWLAIVYITIFGLGSILGMMLMSFLMSVPFLLTAGRFAVMDRVIGVAAGGFSFVLGCLLVHEHLVAGLI